MKPQHLQRRRRDLACLLTLAASTYLAVIPSPAFPQGTTSTPPKIANATPAFSEADAVSALNDLGQAMGSDNPRRFLKPFDARKMPGFAAFRDQIAEFFEKYGPIRMNYRLTQVTTEGNFGAATAEITLEADSKQSGSSTLRATVPVRAVFGWDGKAWKIVDWSPREMFR